VSAGGPAGRARLRDLGISIGRYATGPLNAITDVDGVMVGHSTIIAESDAGLPVRTGVTAILPNAGDIFFERMLGGAFILNGAGEMSGLLQVLEWGLVETPILLTNTLSVGTVHEATVRHMLSRHPGIGTEHDVIIPIVGECDDSFMNDIAGGHVRAEHVYEALDTATGGVVAEGNVGGGTGMVAFDLKGGIGTSSRRLPDDQGGYTIGILVMSNVGRLRDLRVDGVPVGEVLEPMFTDKEKRKWLYGSVIVVLATDAPLQALQINRICKRVALGLGRVGSYAAHGSGEIVLGFSTANVVPRASKRRLYSATFLADQALDALYEASIECTEEAMLNAMTAAYGLEGLGGRYAPALPLNVLQDIWQKYRPPGT
jgi:D-aminopeptidase